MEERARTDEAPGVRGYLAIYLKGAFMGAADAVPGVSGGTIALIVGIYDRLIGAITALDPRVLEHVPRLHRREGRRDFYLALVAMDVPFLVVLAAGAFTSLLLVALVMGDALEQHPVPTYAFFFGLIGASAVILRDEVHLDSPGRVAAGVAGLALAFAVSGVTAGDPHLNPPLLILFGAGAIAITAMVLPGISGSFILLLLGLYHFMTTVAEALVRGFRGTLDGNTALLWEPLTAVAVFGIGAVIGLVTISHVVKYALDHYHDATITFLVALMIGALRVPVARVARNVGDFTPSVVVVILLAAAVGAALVLGLDYTTGDIDY